MGAALGMRGETAASSQLPAKSCHSSGDLIADIPQLVACAQLKPEAVGQRSISGRVDNVEANLLTSKLRALWL